MWRTSAGDRILMGAEARLFKAGLTELVERVKEEAHLEGLGYGITLFDELTWSQRLAVLESVASHLLTEQLPACELTAVNEAAVGAIFEHISGEVDLEVDDRRSGSTWRSMILQACHECFDTTDGIPKSVDSHRRDDWHSAVQNLADRILWDRDYEMMGEFLDEPPQQAALRRQMMGIDDDYFAAAAGDLSSAEQIEVALQRLAGILK